MILRQSPLERHSIESPSGFHWRRFLFVFLSVLFALSFLEVLLLWPQAGEADWAEAVTPEARIMLGMSQLAVALLVAVCIGRVERRRICRRR